MPLTPTEIQTVVLKEDDFGHEMRVGNILSNIKYPQIQTEQIFVLNPLHGGTYRDQVTDKPRQFDYRCDIVKGIDPAKSILLAVECKNLNADFPLVVCGRPRTNEESYHIFIQRGDDGKALPKKVDGFNSFYKPDAFVGKSVLRLKRKEKNLCADGDSEIYDRWSQALASTHDLAYGAVYNKPASKSVAFVLPLVVVPDNSLWTASYKTDGMLEGEPKLVNQCEFFVDHPLLIGLPFIVTHIHFVTLTGLSEMLSTFVNNRRVWDTIFSQASSNFGS